MKVAIKGTFLAKRIGIDPVSFSRKKRTSSFSDKEMKTICTYIFSEELIEKENTLRKLLEKAEEDIKEGQL